MNGYYDFSKHSKCIFISFDRYASYYSHSFFSSDTKEWEKLDWEVIERINEKNKHFLYTGSDDKHLPDAKYREKEDKTIFVKNIFTQINDNMRSANIANDILIFLRQLVERYDLKEGRPSSLNTSYYHYTFIVPSSWDYFATETVMRTLFITAGLITENDHQSRLLIFTKLESIFAYLQSPQHIKAYPMYKESISSGKHYIMYEFAFADDTFSVDLDIFSAQYPPKQGIGTYYIPKSIKAISFEMKIALNLEHDVETYLKRLRLDIKTIKILSQELIFLYENKSFSKRRIKHNVKIATYCPFKGLIDKKKLIFTTQHTKIVESITIEDLHPNLFNFLKKKLVHNLDALMNGNNLKNGALFMGRLMGGAGADIFTTFHANESLKKCIARIVYIWSRQFIEKYCDEKFNYKPIHSTSNGIDFKINDLNNGGIFLAKQQIQFSTVCRPPIVISRHKSIKSQQLSTAEPFVEGTKLSYIIHLDITFKSVIASCVFIGDNNCAKKITELNEFEIEPLENFFVKSQIYQERSIFQINNSFMVFMECHFEEYLKLYPKYDKRKKLGGYQEEILIMAQSMISYFLEFSCIGKRNKSCADLNKLLNAVADEIKQFLCLRNNENLIQLRQPKYIHLFLIMYLRYIDTAIKCQLNTKFGTSWKEKKVGYIVSVEKPLMENVFGSSQDLKDSLFRSGMLQKNNSYEKIQIITHGEGVLPAIQHKTKLDLTLKSYFLFAQLQKTYIQLTLHQVVKKSSPTESPSSIIVRDQIIPIENVNDNICKQFWNHIQSNNAIDCCILHKDHKEGSGNMILSQNNKAKVFKELKSYIFETLFSERKDLAMDEIHKILFKNTCNCSIDVSLRNIIDNGLKPIVQNITTIIAASLTNNDLFGNYIVDFVFVVGNIFDFKQDSFIFKTCINIFRHELKLNIETKEKDPQIIMFKELYNQLLKPVINEKPFMFDSLTSGNLYQVSKETYVIYHEYDSSFLKYTMEKFPEKKYARMKGVESKSAATIILRKGEKIPTKGIIKQFDLDLSRCKKNQPFKRLKIKIARLRYSDIDFVNDIVSLNQFKYDELGTFFISVEKMNTSPIVHLEIKYTNHKSFLRFSLKLNGEEFKYEDTSGMTIAMLEPLTIAYF